MRRVKDGPVLREARFPWTASPGRRRWRGREQGWPLGSVRRRAGFPRLAFLRLRIARPARPGADGGGNTRTRHLRPISPARGRFRACPSASLRAVEVHGRRRPGAGRVWRPVAGWDDEEWAVPLCADAGKCQTSTGTASALRERARGARGLWVAVVQRISENCRWHCVSCNFTKSAAPRQPIDRVRRAPAPEARLPCQ